MADADRVARTLDCRVVYCGASEAGKTANLQQLHRELVPESRGKLISPTAGSGDSFFFDFLAVELGEIRGYDVRFHLYTLPGEVGSQEAAGRILRGADALVFVVDSRPHRQDANRRALGRVREALDRTGRSFDDLVLAFQYNRRDAPDALPVEELEEGLEADGIQGYEAVASGPEGVVETLEEVGVDVLESLQVWDEAS